MVSMNMQIQQAMAAQSAQMKEMQEMMDVMRAERSDRGCNSGCGGGRGNGVKQEFIPQANNTASTPGWAQWSNEGGGSWRRREKCNLGAYCWTHEFNSLGFGHTSRNCTKKNEGHKDNAAKTNRIGGATHCMPVRFKL